VEVAAAVSEVAGSVAAVSAAVAEAGGVASAFMATGPAAIGATAGAGGSARIIDRRRDPKNNRDFEIKCDGEPGALDFVLEIAADCLRCRSGVPTSGN
jgi:hypothetical protein